MEYIYNNEPHPRNIIYIYDPVGGNGKTLLIKHTMFHNKGHLIGLDIARDVFQARRTNQYKDTVLVNITRTIPKSYNISELYHCLETIKDGTVFSPKYDSDQFFTRTPHVIIFANELPQRQTFLSFDRWEIYRIQDNKKMHKMSIQEINDIIVSQFRSEQEKIRNFGTKKQYDQLEAEGPRLWIEPNNDPERKRIDIRITSKYDIP